MKKILLFASALAGLFLAGSCQRENLEPMESANTVTYTVQLPGALSTKTIGEKDVDVAAVTELVYEVYRTEATSADDFTQAETLLFHKTATITNGTATVEFELVNDQNFRVLFWAQVPGNGVYNVESLKNVTISQALNANAENYAAFAGADYIKAGESIVGRTLPLVRPIAQLNIGTDNESLSIEGQTQVTIATTAVKVNGLSTSYNVAEDKAGEISAADYVYAAKPVAPTTEYPGLSESTFAVNGTTYNYVAMNYVGFAPQMGTNVEVTYTINTENVGTIENTIDNVPVKANHRTNIIGNLITSMSDYTITLDKEWADEEFNVEVVSVATAQELQDAIDNIQDNAEGNIKLEGNIDLGALVGMISTKADEPVAPTYGLLIPADKTLVLDLNGNTLAQTVKCTASYSMIENRGSLTIIDSKGEGKISFKDTGAGDSEFRWGSYTIFNHGNLVVNSGTIEHTGEHNTPEANVHMYCAIQQNNANAVTTINGGTISTPTYRSIRINSGSANFKGGVMDGQVWVQPFAEGIVLNIEGGSFEPNGGDGSSVFVENAAKAVDFAVTGGFFKTKIGCSVPANLAGAVTGGTFTESAKANTPKDLYAGYYFVQDGENYVLEQCPVKIGETAYATLTAAVAAVQEGETITILAGKTLEEGTIKLPATLKNVTFRGTERAVLKNMTVSAADGNSYSYVGLTFDGLTFDNSGILLTGWRNGDEVIENLAITNCTFQNLDNTTSTAPVHINKDAPEAVKNFTFTNNVIDGATGGSKSGIYAQVTGEVLVSGNIINNVAFRPYVIQVTTDDNVADNFVVTNNTFSGSAVGRAQGLGNNAEGTDAVNIVVTENIFKGITGAQQICYWNFNSAKTTADLSHNYYDIDILANPGKIYYNSAAANVYDLLDMGVFPIYTDEAKTTLYTPEVKSAKIGENEYSTLEEAVAAAKADDTITVLCNVTLSESLTLPAGIIFNGNGKQINGTINAGGNLTFAGHTKVTSFSASYYNRTITIGEGACLEVTGGGRVTLGYGNTFNITGNIENAKTADKANVQPSLIIPAGISITGGNNAAMNVTNAYVQIGSTTSKPGAANGEFTLNFTNSIVEFTKELGFYAPTGGVNPQFKMSVTNSVFTTGAKLCVAVVNSTITVNNSNVLLGTYLRNSGTLNIIEGSVLTGKTIQFGENGGNDGTINVDASTLEIVAGSTGHAFDGKGIGSINAENGASVKVDYYKAMTINTDATSTFEGTEVK